jgi:competence protein ComEA
VVEPDLTLRGRAREGANLPRVARLAQGGTSMIQRLVTLVVLAALAFPVSALAAPGQQAPPETADTARAAAVNLNTATSAQLEGLPGIGAKTAQRILEYRQKSGGFKKVEELMNVKGIGEKSFLKLKPHITVGTPKA